MPKIDQLSLFQATVFHRCLCIRNFLGIRSTQTWRSGQNLGTWAPLQFWNEQGDIKTPLKPLLGVFWVDVISLVSLRFPPELAASCNGSGAIHFLKTKSAQIFWTLGAEYQPQDTYHEDSKMNWFRVVNGASPEGPTSPLLDRAGLHMRDLLEMFWMLQLPYALLACFILWHQFWTNQHLPPSTVTPPVWRRLDLQTTCNSGATS